MITTGDLFWLHQRQLVNLLNNSHGRSYAEIPAEWGNYPCVQVGTNHATFRTGRNKFIGKFWVGHDILARQLGIGLTSADIVGKVNLPSLFHYLGIKENRFAYPQILMTTTNYNTGAGDGRVLYDTATEAFATMRARATGSIAQPTETTTYCTISLAAGTDCNQIDRMAMPSDTSAITSAATVTAASLNLYTVAITNTASANIYTVTTSLAATTTIALGDFDQDKWGGASPTDQGNAALSGWSTSQYNAITLNATGLTNISKTATTQLGTRMGADFTNTHGGSAVTGQVQVNTSENASNKPYYAVTYSTASGNFLAFM